MSSLENWKPLAALCILGAVIHEQAMVVRFEHYRDLPRARRDVLFAGALYEVAHDAMCERGELPTMLARIRVELKMGSLEERMRIIGREGFAFIGVPLADSFALPHTDQTEGLIIVLKAHMSQHPEWRETIMAVSDRYITLVEEASAIS